MKSDLILLFVGVILGFASSVGTLKYQEYCQRKKALKLLRIEISKIINYISPFTIKNNKVKSENGEIAEFTGISIHEIPNFKMIMQLDLLLNLEDDFRQSVYSISNDLESAEKNRLYAIPLLQQHNKTIELDLYATIYFDYLTSAKEKIEKLIEKLKITK